MSSPLDVLVAQGDAYFQQNATYKINWDGFKQAPFTHSIDQLLTYDWPEMTAAQNYNTAVILVKYRREAPLGGVTGSAVCSHLLKALPLVGGPQSDVGKFLVDMYIGAARKEFNSAATISDFQPWLKVYRDLSSVIDVSSFKVDLSLGITTKAWDIVEEVKASYDNQTLLSSLETLSEFQKTDIDLDATVYNLFESINRYLVRKYNLYMPQENANQDFKEGRKIVCKLSLLKLTEQTQENQRTRLRQFIGEEDPEAYDGPFIRSNDALDPGLKDIDALTNKNPIYVGDNGRVKVVIYHSRSQYGEYAIKEYTVTNDQGDYNRINNEIEIMIALSFLSTNDNCFIKYHGKAYKDNKVYLIMDYHETTLFKKIKDLNEKKTRFSDSQIKTLTEQLINAFNTLESMKIYHQDIKPHNILLTKNNIPKIIDFGIAHKKDDNSNQSVTGSHFVQGTRAYMAPEIGEAFLADKTEANYRRNKADVFSLGMTLLQMYNLDELQVVNTKQTHENLMKKVAAVHIDWLRALLTNMLAYDSSARLTLGQCWRHLNDSTVHPVIHKNK